MVCTGINILTLEVARISEKVLKGIRRRHEKEREDMKRHLYPRVYTIKICTTMKRVTINFILNEKK